MNVCLTNLCYMLLLRWAHYAPFVALLIPCNIIIIIGCYMCVIIWLLPKGYFILDVRGNSQHHSLALAFVHIYTFTWYVSVHMWWEAINFHHNYIYVWLSVCIFCNREDMSTTWLPVKHLFTHARHSSKQYHHHHHQDLVCLLFSLSTFLQHILLLLDTCECVHTTYSCCSIVGKATPHGVAWN